MYVAHQRRLIRTELKSAMGGRLDGFPNELRLVVDQDPAGEGFDTSFFDSWFGPEHQFGCRGKPWAIFQSVDGPAISASDSRTQPNCQCPDCALVHYSYSGTGNRVSTWRFNMLLPIYRLKSKLPKVSDRRAGFIVNDSFFPMTGQVDAL